MLHPSIDIWPALHKLHNHWQECPLTATAMPAGSHYRAPDGKSRLPIAPFGPGGHMTQELIYTLYLRCQLRLITNQHSCGRTGGRRLS